MRRGFVALAGTLLGTGASAQMVEPAPEGRPTAEQFIEAAREVYSVREPTGQPCPAPVGNEIVVCRRIDKVPDQRLPSPTERARPSGERPPDPIPNAPYVLGLPECGVEVTCHRVGRAPPPIYIIDLAAIPEPLSPEEAARVVRAEDASASIPAEASPAAAR